MRGASIGRFLTDVVSQVRFALQQEGELVSLVERMQDDVRFDDFAHLLLEQALLAEGGQLEDPAAHVRRVNRLLVAAA